MQAISICYLAENDPEKKTRVYLRPLPRLAMIYWQVLHNKSVPVV